MRRSLGVALLGLAVVAGPSVARAGEPVWGKEMVAGKEFPLPFGVGVTYFTQDQEYNIDKLTVGIPGLPGLPTQFIRVDNQIDEVNAKVDVWLLPWLNVFGIAGQLDGETEVDLSGLPIPLSNFGIPFDRLTIKYDGEVYGGGIVLAGGTDRFFVSLTTIATQTSLSGDFDSEASALVITPRVGVYNRRGALFAGAMYQQADEKHTGTIGLPLVPGLPPIPVAFGVELSQKEDWNWVLGGVLALGERWSLELEGGFGDRDHLNAALTWRF